MLIVSAAIFSICVLNAILALCNHNAHAVFGWTVATLYATTILILRLQ